MGALFRKEEKTDYMFWFLFFFKRREKALPFILIKEEQNIQCPKPSRKANKEEKSLS